MLAWSRVSLPHVFVKTKVARSFGCRGHYKTSNRINLDNYLLYALGSLYPNYSAALTKQACEIDRDHLDNTGSPAASTAIIMPANEVSS